jgi:NADH dehydrogenase [ubiquinone] 1 alpha subcomplex assembly factor 5
MTPSLFDKNHLHKSKLRAQKQGYEGFIFARIEEDYKERRTLINRTFEKHGEVGEILPQDEGYDLITSHLILQTQEDVVGQLIQTRLKLKSDGLFMGTVLGGETLQELRLAFLAAEAALGLPHTPHVLPFMDVRTAGTLLQRAGFALPVVESEIVTLHYGSLMRLFKDLRGMGATNCLLTRSRHFMRRELFLKTLEIYEQNHANSQGKAIVTLEILHLLGWSPHASQQKPLARGSVKQGFNTGL